MFVEATHYRESGLGHCQFYCYVNDEGFGRNGVSAHRPLHRDKPGECGNGCNACGLPLGQRRAD